MNLTQKDHILCMKYCIVLKFLLIQNTSVVSKLYCNLHFLAFLLRGIPEKSRWERGRILSLTAPCGIDKNITITKHWCCHNAKTSVVWMKGKYQGSLYKSGYNSKKKREKLYLTVNISDLVPSTLRLTTL